MKYHIETPNKNYCGVTFTVHFENGLGYTDDKRIRDILVNDFHYEDVTPKVETKVKKAKPSTK